MSAIQIYLLVVMVATATLFFRDLFSECEGSKDLIVPAFFGFIAALIGLMFASASP